MSAKQKLEERPTLCSSGHPEMTEKQMTDGKRIPYSRPLSLSALEKRSFILSSSQSEEVPENLSAAGWMPITCTRTFKRRTEEFTALRISCNTSFRSESEVL